MMSNYYKAGVVVGVPVLDSLQKVWDEVHQPKPEPKPKLQGWSQGLTIAAVLAVVGGFLVYK